MTFGSIRLGCLVFGLLALSALSSDAQAATLAEVCNKLPLPMMRIQCVALGSDGRFDPAALSACGRITDNQSNFGIYACVVSIKDREYNQGEVKTCDDLTDVESTLSCFRSVGHRAQSGNGVSIEMIRQDAQSALNFLYRGDQYSAQDTLQLLLRKLQSSGSARY